MTNSYPCPIDFAAAWHACTEDNPQHRCDAAADLAFWQDRAAWYDIHSGALARYEQTLAAISRETRAQDTLLDVGAGTGRFAIPLAAHVRQVTALDHAAPMLDILRAKLARDNIENVRIVEASWEDISVNPLATEHPGAEPHEIAQHDIVLAAWSLYRLPDILAGMRKLIAATRRTLFIVAKDGDSLRHDPLLREIWPEADEPVMPQHLYLYGVLWQAGEHADLQIVYERQITEGRDAGDIAQQLAPKRASPQEIALLSERLAPLLKVGSDSCRYVRPEPVGVITWRADRGEQALKEAGAGATE